ncbi:hypothetical protein [Leucobacter salsicius]|uniref:hypothetical protein n=1 Tax=Leucobacter salsicius TaxID=664638 RepID=UPI00034DEA55|nr:hypothetical protein [Leucobacter salsicius]
MNIATLTPADRFSEDLIHDFDEGFVGYQVAEPFNIREKLALPEWDLTFDDALTYSDQSLIAKHPTVSETSLLILAMREDTTVYALLQIAENTQNPSVTNTVLREVGSRLEDCSVAAAVIAEHPSVGLELLADLMERELTRTVRSIIFIEACVESYYFSEACHLLAARDVPLPECWQARLIAEAAHLSMTCLDAETLTALEGWM